jgi:hypothetical protein
VRCRKYFGMTVIVTTPVLGIGADTGLWLMPVQYEQKARAKGNTIISEW